MTSLILKAIYETLGMVGVSTLFSLLLGLPLALCLNVTSGGGLCPHKGLYQGAGFLINAIRSIPYIILTILILPMTKFLVGTSLGMWAAVVPLSLAGALLVARMAEDSLRQVPRGLVEVGLAAGATHLQIIRTVILPEAMPTIVAGATTVIINLIGFSAMAGTVGGGGLGALAIQYGYNRYDVELIFIIVVILIVLVQSVQMIGDRLVSRMTRV